MFNISEQIPAVPCNDLTKLMQLVKEDLKDVDKTLAPSEIKEREILSHPHFMALNVIGANIRYFRVLANLTQYDLAVLSGKKSRSYISQIENGALLPSLTLLVRLAAALKVAPAALLLDPDKDDFYIWYKALLPRQRKLLHKQAQFIHITEGTYLNVPNFDSKKKTPLYKDLK